MVKKIIGMVLAFLAVTVLGVGVFAYTIYQQGTETLSRTYKKIGASIAPYLNSDRKKARKIREIVDNGKITSGYYMLPPLPSGLNRYILFSNLTNNSGAIIYIEGTLGPDDIMKLCYAKH